MKKIQRNAVCSVDFCYILFLLLLLEISCMHLVEILDLVGSGGVCCRLVDG